MPACQLLSNWTAPLSFARSIRNTRHGVIGISGTIAPIAFATADAIADMLTTIGPSPTSFAPNGPKGSMVSIRMYSSSGSSVPFERRGDTGQ